MRRTLVEKEEAAVALSVQLVGRPKTAVQNVTRAVRARLALGVNNACRGNIARVAIQMLLLVLIVPLVLVKVIQDKRRAFHAVPVNSTMLHVPSSVNFVSMRRTLVEKEEAAVALIAQLVGRPKTAVQNVSCAKRVKRVLASMTRVTTARPVGFVRVA